MNTNDELGEAFDTILNAEKHELAEYYRAIHEDSFSDSSAVHCESDLCAWVQQQFIKSVLGHLHGVPAKLRVKLDNPDGADLE